MSKKYNVVQAQQIPTGTRWIQIGTLLEKEQNKMSIKMDVLPIANKDGEIWLQVYERKENEIS